MPGVFVLGTPVPQGGARAFSVGGVARVTASNKAKVNPWRADIHATVAATTGPEMVYVVGPVMLVLEFVMPRAKSEPKRSTRPHVHRPDIDKLTRAVLDALHGVLYRDDSQVTRLVVDKRTAEIGEQPGVLIAWSRPREART